MPAAERWHWIINSYEEWIEAGHDMKPQIDLVKQIADSKYAEELYPSTSMSTLLISNFEDILNKLKLLQSALGI